MLRAALALALLLGPTLTFAQPGADADRQAVDRVRQAFNRAYDAGDADAIARLLTEDATFLPPGEQAVTGRDAIRKRYADQFQRLRSKFVLREGEIVTDGALAYLRGPFERADTPLAGGETRRMTGDYLLILRRQQDGWKISRDIWTVRAEGKPAVAIDVAVKQFKSLAETELRSALDLLRVVAALPEAQRGDWAALKPSLEGVSKARPDASAVWFARPDGTYWTVEKGATGQSLRDRAYFPALVSGQSVEGALVVSRSTGQRSVVVAEPIRRGGQVVGAVGLSLSVEQLSNALKQQLALPANMIFYALDSKGQTALHYDPKLMFAFPSDMGGPTLKTAVREILSRQSGSVRYEFRGVPKTVYFERSKLLGWVFVLGVNEPAPVRGVGGAGSQ